MTTATEDESRVGQYFSKLRQDELHIFARSGGAIGHFVLGPWAKRIAVDYLRSASTIKPFGPAATPSVFVNDSAVKEIIRDALLLHGVAVSQHEKSLAHGGWACVRRGSPGNLGGFEGMLFEFAAGAAEVSSATLMAVAVTQASTTVGAGRFVYGVALVNATLRTVAVAEFTDGVAAHGIDTIVSQYSVREILHSDRLEATMPGVFASFRRIVDRVGAAQLKPLDAAGWTLGAKQSLTQSASSSPTQTRGSAEATMAALKPLLRKGKSEAASYSFFGKDVAALALNALMNDSGVLSQDDATNLNAFTLNHADAHAFLRLDTAAVAALDLVDTGALKTGNSEEPAASGGGGGDAAPLSIYSWLNQCTTGMGSRLMRQYLLQPLRDVGDIDTRQRIVEAMVNSTLLRDALKNDVFRHLTDLDRLTRRLQRCTASLKEIYALNGFLDAVPNVVHILQRYEGPNAKLMADEYTLPLTDIAKHMATLRVLLESTLVVTNNTPKINPNFDDALMTLHEQSQELHAAAAKETDRVLRACGWAAEKVLKCEPHAGTGALLFRVSRKEDKPIRDQPGRFRIFSTSKEGVKFSTEELDRISADLKRASAEYDARQRALQLKLIETVGTYVPLLDDARELLAQLDVFCAWGTVVAKSQRPMVKPLVRAAPATPSTEADPLVLRGLRHPLVEARQGSFIGNDVVLGAPDAGLWTITGPNMGGKSTLMRSVGVAVVLAHAGCYVPADEAEVTVRDSVLCRVGAVDFISHGLSTFMVEMVESSAILSAATSQSLVVVDELGRGTSTFDGFGLAWAIAEELALRVRSQTLFASHYHELCQLEDKLGKRVVRNVHVTAETVAPRVGQQQHQQASLLEPDERKLSGSAMAVPGLKFLYKLAPGPAKQSFGIHVARLAGMPPSVVAAAHEKAAEMEVFDAPCREDTGKTEVKLEDPSTTSQSHDGLRALLSTEERSVLLHAVEVAAKSGLPAIDAATVAGVGTVAQEHQCT